MELFVICILLVTQYKSQFYRLTATKLSSLSAIEKNLWFGWEGTFKDHLVIVYCSQGSV